MKAGNWWIKQGLLTSGDDPTREMATAADQFPDEYTPLVFMTGDGHRSPPFGWTTRGVWPGFFRDIVETNKICCHVETYSDAVTVNSVPANLAAVFRNGKVFGWEPDVYKTIQNVLEDIMDMLPELHMGQAQSKSSIRNITSAMWRVHDMGYLRVEGAQAMQFWDTARAHATDPVPVVSLAGFLNFLTNYNRTAMQLRTGINNVIGANIQKKINQYPDHMHLITCGDAHIIHNPLQRYITPATGTFGVVDQNSN